MSKVSELKIFDFENFRLPKNADIYIIYSIIYSKSYIFSFKTCINGKFQGEFLKIAGKNIFFKPTFQKMQFLIAHAINFYFLLIITYYMYVLFFKFKNQTTQAWNYFLYKKIMLLLCSSSTKHE